MSKPSARKIIAFIIPLLYSSFTFCQKAQSFELSLTSENDSYTLRDKDGYYTNGIMIDLRWKNKKDTANKTIHQLEIGQLMYNAKNGSYAEVGDLDRPITAWLYAAYQQTHFTPRENVWQANFSAGMIGPQALGRQVQEGIHSLLGMYKPREWKFQLKTEVGANLSLQWSPQIAMGSSWFAFKPIIGGTLGTSFTHANIGAVFILGKINTNSQSVFWNARLNTNARESFFYFYPQLRFKEYDATVQGGRFRSSDDKGDFVGVLNRTLFLPRMGWMYANKNFSLHLALTHTGKESKSQLESQWYGTIGLGFKL